jgi:hypothetical protein
LQVRHTHVATLPGQAVFDLMILGFSDFHRLSAYSSRPIARQVITAHAR